MIIVMKLSGKGSSSADYVSAVLFDNRADAQKFVDEVTDLDSKYWTAAQIVDSNEQVGTYREYFK